MNHTTWCDTCALVHTEKKGTFMCFCECHNGENTKHASGKITANGIEVAAPTKSAEKPTDTADNTPDQLISILRNHVGETGESEDAVEVLLRLLKEHKCPLVASTDNS